MRQAERRGVEASNRADGGATRLETLPQPLHAGPDGGHRADAGDDNPAIGGHGAFSQ